MQNLNLQDLLSMVKMSVLISIGVRLIRGMLTCVFCSLLSVPIAPHVSNNERGFVIVFHCLTQLTPVYSDEITSSHFEV